MATASATVPRVRALEIPRRATSAPGQPSVARAPDSRAAPVVDSGAALSGRGPLPKGLDTPVAPEVDSGATPGGRPSSNQASNSRVAPAAAAGAAPVDERPAGLGALSGNAAGEFGSYVPAEPDESVWDFRELGVRKTSIAQVMDALPGFRPALEGFAEHAGGEHGKTMLRTILQKVAGDIRGGNRPRRGISGGAAGRTGARMQSRIRELEDTERRLRDELRALERARMEDRDVLREERQQTRQERARANEAEAHANRLAEELRHLRGRGMVRRRSDEWDDNERPPRRPRRGGYGDYEHGHPGHDYGWYGGGPGPSGGGGGMAA